MRQRRGRPELPRQPKPLRDLIQGEEVLIDTVARDQFGRSVANVKVGGKSVNKAMQGKVKK